MNGASDPGPYLGFQIKHIGDFLHTLPALGFLKKQFPGRKPALVVSPQMAGLAEAHPWVERLFVLNRAEGLGHLVKLAGEIRRQGYNSAFVFDGQDRSILTAFLGGLKNRVGATGLYPLRGWRRFLYTADVEISACRDWRLASQAHRGLVMVAAHLGLGLQPPPRPPMPELGPEHRAKAEELLDIPGSGPLIGLTLQGLQPEKSWPLADFSALALRLCRELNARLYVTGGPGESPAAEALARSSGVPVKNLCGQTGLLDLVALADRSDLFITVDTGTSHIVALTETPLISLFIWTSPALWPPQTPHLRILCYDWCLARFKLEPDEGPWRSAPLITPEMVFEEALAVLG